MIGWKGRAVCVSIKCCFSRSTGFRCARGKQGLRTGGDACVFTGCTPGLTALARWARFITFDMTTLASYAAGVGLLMRATRGHSGCKCPGWYQSILKIQFDSTQYSLVVFQSGSVILATVVKETRRCGFLLGSTPRDRGDWSDRDQSWKINHPLIFQKCLSVPWHKGAEKQVQTWVEPSSQAAHHAFFCALLLPRCLNFISSHHRITIYYS